MKTRIKRLREKREREECELEKPLNNRCFLLGCALIAKAIEEGTDEEAYDYRLSSLMDEVSDMLNILLDIHEDNGLLEDKPA